MVTDPMLLFCDEPTTGLDSFSACSVVTVLRTVAARGKTVICSIHQPSSEVFQLFDQLCLLVPGGGLAYYGPAANAKDYFDKWVIVESFNTILRSSNKLIEKYEMCFLSKYHFDIPPLQHCVCHSTHVRCVPASIGWDAITVTITLDYVC